MKSFRVLMRGENFFMKFEDPMRAEESIKRMGFYATRVVEAGNEEEAEQRAVESLRQDEKLRCCVLNDQADPPTLFAEEIEELASFGERQGSPSGFTFYDDEQNLN